MNAEQRRTLILTALKDSTAPVSASALAERCSVSRQIIVGDIALLRASGTEILATPRGYTLQSAPAGLLRQVAVQHDFSGMEAELFAIVDQGCTVLDVVVEHPLYGQLTGPLQLSNRYEVQQFLIRCENSQPLSNLTDGIHLHTLSCPSEESYERALSALRSLGILLET